MFSKSALVLILEAIDFQISELENNEYYIRDENFKLERTRTVNNGTREGAMLTMLTSKMTGMEIQINNSLVKVELSKEEKDFAIKSNYRNNRQAMSDRRRYEELKVLREYVLKLIEQ